jgi:hypothetical protein
LDSRTYPLEASGTEQTLGEHDIQKVKEWRVLHDLNMVVETPAEEEIKEEHSNDFTQQMICISFLKVLLAIRYRIESGLTNIHYRLCKKFLDMDRTMMSGSGLFDSLLFCTQRPRLCPFYK